LVTDSANRHDSRLLASTLDSALVPLPAHAELLVDAAYRGPRCARETAEYRLRLSVTDKTRAATKRRSPIERTHKNFNHWRGVKTRVLRLQRRWTALLQLAAAIITFRATSHRIATST
jgi:hypothetical protein